MHPKKGVLYQLHRQYLLLLAGVPPGLPTINVVVSGHHSKSWRLYTEAVPFTGAIMVPSVGLQPLTQCGAPMEVCQLVKV